MESEILSADARKSGEFAIYNVDRALLPVVHKWPRTGQAGSSGWLTNQKGPLSQIIASGDKLTLQIWDNTENSLLTPIGQKSVAMSEVVVSPDGSIFVPYLDKIYIIGMTADKAREMLQERISQILPSAQVQLTLTTGRRNSVDLVGGANSGNFPLPDRNFTVLNLISLGGGVTAGIRNPQVHLVRDGKNYRTSISNLYSNPSLDTTLRGGDKVIVREDSRSFLALGAASTQKEHFFEKDRISALDAMAMMGGVSETRGDPSGILVLRRYNSKSVRTDGKGPSNIRAVFVLDLTSADGLFSAGEFEVYPNDVVLATESPVNSVQTVFRLIGSAFAISANF